jgi:hypothetical protein
MSRKPPVNRTNEPIESQNVISALYWLVVSGPWPNTSDKAKAISKNVIVLAVNKQTGFNKKKLSRATGKILFAQHDDRK